MIKAVIFDMDGILIDSEPFWQQEEIRMFGELGVNITKELHETTLGMGTDEVVEHWYNYKPWNGPSQYEVREELLKRVSFRIINEGEALPGVEQAIRFFEDKKISIALASSSPIGLINDVIKKLKIQNRFALVCTAEDVGFGKPHPAVYIATAEKLDMHPSNCLAIEDSINGVLSAKSARMRVLAIPDKDHLNDPRFGIADLKLASLQDFNEENFQYLNAFD